MNNKLLSMTRQERHFVGRVMNCLRRKPCYMTLRELAEIWGFSIHYTSIICDIARSPL